MLLGCVSETEYCPFRVLPDPLSAHARAEPPRGGTGQSQITGSALAPLPTLRASPIGLSGGTRITARSPFPLRYEELYRPLTMSCAGDSRTRASSQ